MADVGESPPQRFLFVYSSQVSALFIIIWLKRGVSAKKNRLRKKPLKLQLQISSPSFVQILSHFKQFYLI